MKTKVLFFTPSLGSGGAERQLLTIANELPPESFEVCILAARHGGSYECELQSHVRLVHPDRAPSSSTLGLIYSAPTLLRLLKSFKPDIFMTMLTPTTLVGGFVNTLSRSSARHVIGIQNNYLRELHANWRGPWRWLIDKWFLRVVRRSAGMVFISHGVADDFFTYSRVKLPPTAVIHNVSRSTRVHSDLDQVGWVSDRPPLSTPPLIIACGRLHIQKDYPNLLRAMKHLLQSNDARLEILGDGPERANLESLVHTLNLGHAVKFLGFQHNPEEFMRHADLFVLSSQFEGFANVIVEAMEVGVPVVSTDCDYGPREIITHDVNGILVTVGNPIELALGMSRVLSDSRFSAMLVENGRRRSRDFQASQIVPQYAEFLKSIAVEEAKCPG